MVVNPMIRKKVIHKRRPRRLSAVERIVERAEDRFDNREADRILGEPESQHPIPWEQVKKELGF